MDKMRVGFVGEMTDKKMPMEIMDVLTYMVVALLLATTLFIICQMMCKDEKDDYNEGYINTQDDPQSARVAAVNDDNYNRVRSNSI